MTDAEAYQLLMRLRQYVDDYAEDDSEILDNTVGETIADLQYTIDE